MQRDDIDRLNSHQPDTFRHMSVCHLCNSSIPNHNVHCRVWSDLKRFKRVYESFPPERQESDLGLGLRYYIELHPSFDSCCG